MKVLLTYILLVGLFNNIQLEFNKLFIRETNLVLPECVVNKVISDTKGMTYAEIAQYCCEYTNNLLTYSLTPNLTENLSNSQGHCVTYSVICKEMCNIVYRTHNIPAKAYVSVGQIKMNDVNIHNIIKTILPKQYHRFVINHDIVEIVCDNNVLLIDPSLTDLMNVNIKYTLNTTSE
jgi:hypothetical protein